MTSDSQFSHSRFPLLLAILIAAAVVFPRSLSIAHAHSESYDDQFHLIRGLARLRGENLKIPLHDHPPLGEMIEAVPMWLTGCTLNGPRNDALVQAEHSDWWESVLYGQPYSPRTLLMLEAAWNALLFLPLAALIFVWCRRLYGAASAWLALGMLLADPNIAAHSAVVALDLLVALAIVAACFVGWRYVRSPSTAGLIATCAAVAAALLVKHQAIVVPVALAALIICKRLRNPATSSTTPEQSARSQNRFRPLACAMLLIPLFIWTFTLFDVSRPADQCVEMSADYSGRWNFAADVINANLERRWPAGCYIASLVEAFSHASSGHAAFLLGQFSQRGWWYYPFVTAAVKIPVGIGLILLLGFASIFWRRVRFEELGILVPALLYLLMLCLSSIDIGFRHALPAYVLLMMFASRCVSGQQRALQIVCWLAVIASAAHGLWFHPDELSYINLPWPRAERIVSDSNIDWGQSLKQVQQWLDAHSQGNRPVYLAYFGNDGKAVSVAYYLGDRVKLLSGDPPAHGLLILSPVLEVGDYTTPQRFAKERQAEPIAIIGHCMRVYDLDRLSAEN